jgi:hypothetical protein
MSWQPIHSDAVLITCHGSRSQAPIGSGRFSHNHLLSIQSISSRFETCSLLVRSSFAVKAPCDGVLLSVTPLKITPWVSHSTQSTLNWGLRFYEMLVQAYVGGWLILDHVTTDLSTLHQGKTVWRGAKLTAGMDILAPNLRLQKPTKRSVARLAAPKAFDNWSMAIWRICRGILKVADKYMQRSIAFSNTYLRLHMYYASQQHRVGKPSWAKRDTSREDP